jgi:alkylhydroperoxidase/carboxymuconolactone decarboxylase family protein YurZ
MAQSGDAAENAVADAIRIEVAASGIDARTHALTNLAAVIATGVPDPASYVLRVARAMDAGCSADEVIGTLVAVTPNIGMVKMTAAAPLIAAALNIDVAAGNGGGDGGRAGGGGGGGGAGEGGAAGAGGAGGAAGAAGAGGAPGAGGGEAGGGA